MKKILLLFFILIGNKLYSQNLVLNPSFETIRDSCYPYINGIWDSACLNWDCPILQTPDYMNVCSNNLIQGVMGVPINWGGAGFQYPKDGNAYAGYQHISGGIREYIQGTIQDSLTIGKKYRCFYYVSLQSMQFVSTDASNNFGIGFTTYHVKHDSNNVWNITWIKPMINDTTVISDTLNWVKVEGTFIADSAYKFFTIGNFFDEFHTKGLTSYYYLDDVHIEEVKDDGEELVDVNRIKLFPNPASESIVIETTNGLLNGKLQIFNYMGVLVDEIQLKNKNKLILNTKQYLDGLYLFKITDNNSIVSEGKFNIVK
jgi:hypothetical protein